VYYYHPLTPTPPNLADILVSSDYTRTNAKYFYRVFFTI